MGDETGSKALNDLALQAAIQAKSMEKMERAMSEMAHAVSKIAVLEDHRSQDRAEKNEIFDRLRKIESKAELWDSAYKKVERWAEKAPLWNKTSNTSERILYLVLATLVAGLGALLLGVNK